MELNQAAARARTMFVCTTETLAAMRRGQTGGGLGAQAQGKGGYGNRALWRVNWRGYSVCARCCSRGARLETARLAASLLGGMPLMARNLQWHRRAGRQNGEQCTMTKACVRVPVWCGGLIAARLDSDCTRPRLARASCAVGGAIRAGGHCARPQKNENTSWPLPLAARSSQLADTTMSGT